ncbi:hypothetical protein [Saccharopolyspora spinosa]|uniref:Uncharacterized protein n=1 Tax=Saccharopolyspora spinosa TaxID=60894 RepID=A0A2N3XWQ8_SACSN|nr:hypothetical protein [Saccharopolyspora spinosa]PKW15106.1 hypothetical protein A8926_2786 [Saccharopolyspora spinosa]
MTAFYHVCFVVPDLEKAMLDFEGTRASSGTNRRPADSRRLADRGLPEVFSGWPYGRAFAYHRMDSIGARIELVN